MTHGPTRTAQVKGQEDQFLMDGFLHPSSNRHLTPAEGCLQSVAFIPSHPDTTHTDRPTVTHTCRNPPKKHSVPVHKQHGVELRCSLFTVVTHRAALQQEGCGLRRETGGEPTTGQTPNSCKGPRRGEGWNCVTGRCAVTACITQGCPVKQQVRAYHRCYHTHIS